MKIGDKLKAKDMERGSWYRTNRYGRFIAGGRLNDKCMLVYLDGDQDMQSMDSLLNDDEVEIAKPKF